MYKLPYTRFTKLIIDYFLSCNMNIPRIFNSEMHSEGDESPITKLSNIVKVESEKAKADEEPKEQNVSPVKSGKGKEYMHSGDYEANSKMFKKDDVPKKTKSLTVAEETITVELAKSISIVEQRTQQRHRIQLTIDKQIDKDVTDTYAKWGQKLKGLVVDDPVVQLLLDLQKGSKASRLESLKQKNANGTDDTNDSDMDLSDDNPNGDDDAKGFEVFMNNKSTKALKFTYFNPTITIYTDAHTTSVVHNPEGNPKVRSFLSGASEVPFATKPHKILIYPQPNSLQAKAKKLIQKAKKNMRKVNFKKAVIQKFIEYDQRLEALINFNVSEAFEKDVQAKVLTQMKKLLPTHIPTYVANYVKPRLNTSVLKVIKNNQISLFTKSSTCANDLSEIDLKLKLLNIIHLNMSNATQSTH
ncbi:hypothetical protein Tco_0571011 [Tanacetum coccineum]